MKQHWIVGNRPAPAHMASQRAEGRRNAGPPTRRSGASSPPSTPSVSSMSRRLGAFGVFMSCSPSWLTRAVLFSAFQFALVTASGCGSPTDGTVGASCIRTDDCREGNVCREGVCITEIPRNTRGDIGFGCHADGSCNSGGRCEAGTCQACVGESGCTCTQAGACNGGLSCVQGFCTNPVSPPADPRCYSPCRDSFTDPTTGEWVRCDSDGLFEGCRGDNTCVNGSCLTAENIANPFAADVGVCSTDSECPAWQTCIEGNCYSTCDSNSECDSGDGVARACHMHVCRAKCLSGTDVCGPGTFCDAPNGDSGFCMPAEEGAGIEVEPPNVFALSELRLNFNPSVDDHTFTITNQGAREETYTITKAGGPLGPSNLVLDWLTLDGSAEQQITVTIAAGASATVAIAGAQVSLHSSWSGYLTIAPSNGDVKELHLVYFGSPEGQWVGKQIYFANFPDQNLDAWSADPSSISDEQLDNAFIIKWNTFAKGQLSLDEFNAVVQSTIKQSWKSELMRDYCEDESRACYPYDNELGFGVYSTSLNSKDIPSGATELPMVMNLEETADAKVLQGRIETARTLHFPSNPAVTLTFADDPSDCDVGADGTLVCDVASLEATALVGGRYLSERGGDCGLNVESGESGYIEHAIPWLIPGLENNTDFDDATGNLYRYECRDTRLPLSVGANPTADEMKYNTSLAGANPIPDGNTRVRQLEIIDGVMIDQRDLVLIFKETFVSFLGGGPGDTFSAYGLITMSKGAADLVPEDFIGNIPEETRTFTQGLAEPTCSEDLLTELSDIVDSPTLLDPSVADDARIIASQIVEGFSAQPPDEDIIDASDTEHVHWLCEDTGLIDGGRSMDVPCPASSAVSFFTVSGITEQQVRNAACNSPVGITVKPKSDLRYMKCSSGSSCDCRQNPSDCVSCNDLDVTSGCYAVINDGLSAIYEVKIDAPASCAVQIADWEADDAVDIRHDPMWMCKKVDGVRPSSCLLAIDESGLPAIDRRANKDFYVEGVEVVILPSLRDRVAEAFRYKTRFRSRTGGNVGFAPEICAPGVPYCFDPEAVENIAARVDCLLDIYKQHIDDESSPGVPAPFGESAANPLTKNLVQQYLVQNFAQREIRFTQPTDASDPKLLPYPIIHEGYERLLTELMVMLGDEALTQSFASRFDLAGASQLGFEGDLFEPDGLRLSGGAGFELHKLYQAVQYYQYALDRFYRLSPVIWRSARDYGATTSDGFINDATVTAYLERLIRASTQKALAHAEIASRYAAFNEPALARHIVERAYTGTYIESIFISRTMLHLLESAAVGGAARPQIRSAVEKAQLTYRSALLRMQEAYEKIADEITFFGYAPDYVPFPALDPDNATGTNENAFILLLDGARQRLAVAAEKEDNALSQNQSYNVDAVAFQNELLSIQLGYDTELRELCGSFVGVDGEVHPAIAQYAHLLPDGAEAGDPCGSVGTGEITDALLDLQSSTLDLASAKQALVDFEVRQQIIEDDVRAQCQLISDIADYEFASDSAINAWEESQRDMQQGIDALDQFYSQAVDAASIAFGGSELTLGITAGVSAAVAVLGVANFVAGTVLRNQIDGLQTKIADREAATAKWVTQQDCTFALIEANRESRELLLDGYHLDIEAKQAILATQQIAARINGMFQKAQALQAEMQDTQQLAINLESARNDPNVRIYKNDAVRDADRTFERAVASAYRLTKVYEYYTSTSYAKLGDLFLIRLVSRGDLTLEAYVDEIEDAFVQFEELYGRPDLRVLTVSAKDQILDIPRLNGNNQSLSIEARNALFREALFDPTKLDENGHIALGFPVTLQQLSPLTRNHKVDYVEVEMIGEDGDDVTRVYLRQEGTGVVRGVSGDKIYFTFPSKTAVVNSFMNGDKPFNEEVYASRRLKDRPLANTAWSLLLNFRDETDNFDIDQSSLSDIRIYFYYTDFTAL